MNHRFSNLEDINKYNRDHKTTYIKSLIDPFNHIGAKIPSPIPQDSATASIKYNFNVTTNDKGNFLIMFDPFSSQIFVNKDNTLDSLTSSGTALNKFVGTDLPISSDIIDMWRLVSAGISIQYTGQIHLTSGYLLGASTSLVGVKSNDAFLNYNNIEDLPNKVMVMPLEGLHLSYIPVDSEQFVYYPTSDYSINGNTQTRWKSVMVIAGSGLPVNSQCIRVDIVKNIEYVSKTNFREYIHHTQGHSGNVDNSLINQLQDVAVRPNTQKLIQQGASLIFDNIGEAINKNAYNMGQSMMGSKLFPSFSNLY